MVDSAIFLSFFSLFLPMMIFFGDEYAKTFKNVTRVDNEAIKTSKNIFKNFFWKFFLLKKIFLKIS